MSALLARLRTNWLVVVGLAMVGLSFFEAWQGWLWEVDAIYRLFGGHDQTGVGADRVWAPPPWALLYLAGNAVICLGIYRACQRKRVAVEASLTEEQFCPPGTMPATPFYPRFIMREMVMAIGVVGVILILASLLNPSQFFEPSLDEEELFTIEAPADPFETPPGILPEWYFITIFFLLQIMPPWIGMILVLGLFAMGIVMAPFLDNGNQKHPLLRPTVTIAGFMVVSLWFILTLVGEKVLAWRPWEWGI